VSLRSVHACHCRGHERVERAPGPVDRIGEQVPLGAVDLLDACAPVDPGHEDGYQEPDLADLELLVNLELANERRAA
jgi:hypothetical protein